MRLESCVGNVALEKGNVLGGGGGGLEMSISDNGWAFAKEGKHFPVRAPLFPARFIPSQDKTRNRPAPASAKAIAIALPIPRVAPVTTATLPSSLNISRALIVFVYKRGRKLDCGLSVTFLRLQCAEKWPSKGKN